MTAMLILVTALVATVLFILFLANRLLSAHARCDRLESQLVSHDAVTIALRYAVDHGAWLPYASVDRPSHLLSSNQVWMRGVLAAALAAATER